MEQRMSEMAAQLGQNHEETQATSSHKEETEVSGHDRTPSPKQTQKQKRNQIASDLVADIKKIKPPKFLVSKSGEEAKAWLTEMEQYFEIRNFSETSKVVRSIYNLIEEVGTWCENTKIEQNIKTTELT